MNATGNCYESAFKDVDNAAFEGEGLTLVHGRVTGQGPIEGMRIGHAWAEAGEFVIDNSNGKSINVPRAFYYAVGGIEDEECRKYSRDEAAEWAIETGHYGPWEDRHDIYEEEAI